MNGLDSYYETILWCATKYALCLEEGEAVEAVLHTMKSVIPDLSNQTLAGLLTEVEAYVYRGRQMDFDAKFLPEWSDALAWLLTERKKREREAS